MGAALELTDANFEDEVLKSDQPVLVDFWAPHCGPCRTIAPIIEELAQDYDGTAKVGKLDTETSRAAAQKYGVLALPTLMVFKDGEPVKQFVGAQAKRVLQEALDEAVG